MKRRSFLKISGGTVLSLAMASCQHQTTKNQPQGSKPNIIVVLADDLGYGDLGCYGQVEMKTPNLDQMAREGMRFTQHYAGSTVCAPSRCSLMTGKHVGHCTVRGNVDILMKSNETTIAKELKKAGYKTACIGKWGIGHPPPASDPHDNGFDYFFGYLSMWHAHNYYPDFLWKNGKKMPLRNVVQHPETHYKESQESLVGYASKRIDYTSDLFTQEGLAWIEKTKEPFFLFMAYTIPHANNEATDIFGASGMEVPDLGIYKDKKWPEAEKGKAAMISRLDRDMGRLFAKLKALGIDENTLVIFTSDNGPHEEGGVDPDFFNSNGLLRGVKRDLYEGGIRVPMIARWPGQISVGVESDHISAFWDYLPTFAEIAGEKPPEETDGISMLPSMRGDKAEQKQHSYLYWEFHEGRSKQAVRMGKWKGVRNAPSSPFELYDLSVDSGEKNNLADRYPAVVKEILEILADVRTDEDQWPLVDNKQPM